MLFSGFLCPLCLSTSGQSITAEFEEQCWNTLSSLKMQNKNKRTRLRSKSQGLFFVVVVFFSFFFFFTLSYFKSKMVVIWHPWRTFQGKTTGHINCHVTIYICRNRNSKQPFGSQWILEQYSLLPHGVTFTTLGWTTNLPVNFKGNY